LRIISKYKPPRLIFGGAYYRRYFCVSDLGGLYTEGLIHGGAYFFNFTVNGITFRFFFGGKFRKI